MASLLKIKVAQFCQKHTFRKNFWICHTSIPKLCCQRGLLMSLDLPEAKIFKKSTTNFYMIGTLCAFLLLSSRVLMVNILPQELECNFIPHLKSLQLFGASLSALISHIIFQNEVARVWFRWMIKESFKP